MKWIKAIVGGILMFLATFVVVSLVLVWVLPEAWAQYVVSIGAVSANLPSILALMAASLAAGGTFKASFKAKTGKLYRKDSGRKTSTDTGATN